MEKNSGNVRLVFKLVNVKTGEELIGTARELSDKYGFSMGLIHQYSGTSVKMKHTWLISVVDDNRLRKYEKDLNDLERINNDSRNEGLSYGQYVAKYGL